MAPAYQTLTVDFEVRLQEMDYIEPFDLCRIGAWKSARIPALICLNDPDRIKEVTKVAKSELSNWLRGRNLLDAARSDAAIWVEYERVVGRSVGDARTGAGLLGLTGVGYPMASAILRVWNRRAFPVVDRFAVADVFGRRIDLSRFSASRYREYAEKLSDRYSETDPTADIHDLDLMAMKAGKARWSEYTSA